MRKAVGFAGLLGICVFLTGCANFSPQVTGISVNKKGVITEVIKENFEDAGLNEEELQTQIDSEVEAFNTAAGMKRVKASGLKVKNGIASLEMIYAAYKDYAEFNHVDFYIGDVHGAVQKGYTFQGVFHEVSGSSVQEANVWGSEIMNSQDQYQVLVISEALLVKIPGTIRYVSDGVKVTGSNEAVSETDDLAYIIFVSK